MNNLPAVMSANEVSIIDQGTATPEAMKAQVLAIQKVMADVMQKDTHYGVIPGTKNPTLLKPGAEKICMMFRLLVETEEKIVEMGNGHREYTIKTLLKNSSGVIMGTGLGSCSTMESKYRWRQGERRCPSCQKATIIKGRAEYGGGWLCFAKKGGCGAKFPDGDQSIEGQNIDRVENPDIADLYNTCLKMAKKRSFVDATLTTTAASDIFTQDMEETAAAGDGAPPPSEHPAAAQQQRPPQQPPPARPQPPPAAAPKANPTPQPARSVVAEVQPKQPAPARAAPSVVPGSHVAGQLQLTTGEIINTSTGQIIGYWKPPENGAAPGIPTPAAAAPTTQYDAPAEPSGVLDDMTSPIPDPRNIDWNSFAYRYHLPVKSKEMDMDVWRATIKESGGRFRSSKTKSGQPLIGGDDHWYVNHNYPQLSKYMRPLPGQSQPQPHVQSIQSAPVTANPTTLAEDEIPAEYMSDLVTRVTGE